VEEEIAKNALLCAVVHRTSSCLRRFRPGRACTTPHCAPDMFQLVLTLRRRVFCVCTSAKHAGYFREVEFRKAITPAALPPTNEVLGTKIFGIEDMLRQVK